MATTVQARLDAETAAILKRVARERGWSSSQAVREGIHLLAPQSDAVKSVQIHGLGMFDAGVTDLATNKKHLEGLGRSSMPGGKTARKKPVR